MNLRQRRREEPDINLTPLIDVVFLLLIFFMVSTTFRREADFKIELPEASQKPVPEEQQLILTIDAAGRYFIQDRELPDTRLVTIKKALIEATGENRDLPLTIRADGRTLHQAVVRAMDAAGQAGLRHLAIATVHSAGKPEDTLPSAAR